MADGGKVSTNMRSDPTLQLPTAWAFDSGFKAGPQRSSRQSRPFSDDVWTSTSADEVNTTKVTGHAPEHLLGTGNFRQT